jgi:tetratricopeptide (TPR) repeat protein
MPAAIKLLDRAVALLTDQHPARLELVRELSSASWAVGELARAESLLDGLLDAASVGGDRRIQWYALLERAIRRNMTDPSPTGEDLQEVTGEAIRVFEDLGDDVGLARAWRSLSWAPRSRGHFAIAEDAVERALHYARQAGNAQEEARSIDVLCSTLLYGPTPAGEAIRRFRELLARARENRLMEASVATSLAGFLAMQGKFDEAHALASRAESIYEDLGLRLPLVAWTEVAGFVKLLADDPAAAEAVLRRGYDLLSASGPSAVSAFQAGLLAVPVLALGRYEEADQLARMSEDGVAADAIEAQVRCRQTRALLHAHAGQMDDALALARDAVESAAQTDALNMRADALFVFAEVLLQSERAGDAAEAMQDALGLYEQKGNVVSAQRAASRLASPADRASFHDRA